MSNESSYTASVAAEVKILKDKITLLEAAVVEQGSVTAPVTAAMAAADAQVVKVTLLVPNPEL